MNMLRGAAIRQAFAATALGLAAMHSAQAVFVNSYIKRDFSVGARAQEFAPNCNPCGEDQDTWIIKGQDNGKELTGYDSLFSDYGTNDLNAGNQSLSFAADYRGMHAQVSSERQVDFLSPDVMRVNVTGHVDITHPGGADLLRDKGEVSGFGHSSTEFSFFVERPTLVEVTVDMSFKDLVTPVGTAQGGLAGLFTFQGGNLDLSYTAADFAKGPLTFTTTLLQGPAASVSLVSTGSRTALGADHAVSDWQASVTIRAVPEPSGWALLPCVLLAGGWIVRRDRRTKACARAEG